MLDCDFCFFSFRNISNDSQHLFRPASHHTRFKPFMTGGQFHAVFELLQAVLFQRFLNKLKGNLFQFRRKQFSEVFTHKILWLYKQFGGIRRKVIDDRTIAAKTKEEVGNGQEDGFVACFAYNQGLLGFNLFGDIFRN